MLADAVLILHFLFVAFVVGGFALILCGAALGWSWVRARGFRWLHLGAIVFVAAESLLGLACPLTLWEAALRQAGPLQTSFVGHWVSRLLYYDLPEWVFSTAYTLFALAVLLAWWLVPPHPGNPDRSAARSAR